MGSIPSIIAELCTFSETYKKTKKIVIWFLDMLQP